MHVSCCFTFYTQKKYHNKTLHIFLTITIHHFST